MSLYNEFLVRDRQTWEWKYFFLTTGREFFFFFYNAFSCGHPGYLTQQEKERILFLQLENNTSLKLKSFHTLPLMEEKIQIMGICLKYPHALL